MRRIFFKNSKICLSLLACFVISLNLIFIGAGLNAEGKSEVTFNDVVLQSRYVKNTIIEVPQSSFSDGGTEVPATSELVFPDGSATRLKTVKLDKTGNYRLYYRAVIGDKQYVEQKEFNVYDNLYSVSSDRSSAKYEYSDYFGSANATYGVKVSLSPGDIFTYNKTIDLRNFNTNEDFIRVRITPNVQGEREFSEMLVILTDAYDPTNYVTVSTLAHPDANTAGVIKAGASNQDLSGYEQRKEVIHVLGQWGFPAYISFDGIPTTNNQANHVAFGFDYETGAVTAVPRTGNTNIVAVLKDLFFFKNIWEGFTTGEVYVSIKANGYVRQEANFVLTKLAGEDLSLSEFADIVPPNIEIDTEGYPEDEIPSAVVGNPYKVYNARSFDAVSGELKTYINVYRGYYSGRISVSVQNGYFIPSSPGEYTIEYKAVDGNGNESTKLLSVTAVNETEELLINIDPERVTSGIVYERIKAPQCSPSGGSGNVDVKVQVIGGGETIETLPGGVFFLKKAGKYTVKYIGIDRAGNESEEEYNLFITNGNAPVFIQEPVLPKYFQVNGAHILPEVYAYNYTNGSGEPVKAQIYVNDKDGYRLLSNNVYVPRANNEGGTVTITYAATIPGGGTTTLRYTRPVYFNNENGVIRLEKFFHLDNVSVQTPDTGDYIEFTSLGDGSEMEFVNAVVADGFSTRFSLSTQINAKSVRVVLTDFADPTVAVGFTLSTASSASTTALRVDGDNARYEIKSASFTDGRDYFFKYYNTSCRLLFDNENGSSLTVKKTIYGEDFNGFPSGKVYLKFIFGGPRNSVKMRLKNINEQIISGIDRIMSKPQVTFYPLSRDYVPGEIATIKAAAAADVFDSYVEFNMTVTSPSGTIVVSQDGVTLDKVDPTRDYSIKLTEYGNYVIEYYARNSYGRAETDKGFVIRVVDKQAPTITLERVPAANAKVGDSVYLPKGTASDNFDESVQLKIYVINPEGRMTYIDRTANDSFLARKTGVYTVKYVALDRAGNIAVKEYKVQVS